MTYSLKLDTSRLTIVGINEINMPMLIEYFVDNHTHLKQGGGFVPSTEEEIQIVFDNWLENIGNDVEIRFFIILEDKIIGIIGITNIVRGAFQAAYLGYNLAENRQGKGYMTEALSAVIELAFSALNLHRLMANYRPNNFASGKVLEKLSFQKEGFSEKYILVNGIWEDHILTALRNDEWVMPRVP